MAKLPGLFAKLLGTYGDDIARGVANYSDDAVRAVANYGSVDPRTIKAMYGDLNPNRSMYDFNNTRDAMEQLGSDVGRLSKYVKEQLISGNNSNIIQQAISPVYDANGFGKKPTGVLPRMVDRLNLFTSPGNSKIVDDAKSEYHRLLNYLYNGLK